MPEANPAAVSFLANRRSRPAKTLTTPVPTRPELQDLLTIAARTPDHGKLEPWRFIVLEKAALQRLADTVPAYCTDMDPEKTDKLVAQFANADLSVAVISSPKPSDKIPVIEQTLSAGAVAMNLLSAALAAGWGANWLSGWISHQPAWREKHLGLAPHEWIAGFIHIGTERLAPPERPRPDLSTIVTWVET
ncbi:nitroreductase family protein [Boseongicola aestuarii]|uniref:Putative NAD(P)H nitroreductase n=1 Tax=Boseongicola aestuarii TaxID=1470561 RepID=A0A238J3X4_9RHOB|nr:nitroreductase [Boseongicola aestuarii]SMX24614.1 Putative NAD(P)H nitroreductase YdjA [Boseongicola aestuarii]